MSDDPKSPGCGANLIFNREEFCRAVLEAKKLFAEGTRSVRIADE